MYKLTKHTHKTELVHCNLNVLNWFKYDSWMWGGFVWSPYVCMYIYIYIYYMCIYIYICTHVIYTYRHRYYHNNTTTTTNNDNTNNNNNNNNNNNTKTTITITTILISLLLLFIILLRSSSSSISNLIIWVLSPDGHRQGVERDDLQDLWQTMYIYIYMSSSCVYIW